MKTRFVEEISNGDVDRVLSGLAKAGVDAALLNWFLKLEAAETDEVFGEMAKGINERLSSRLEYDHYREDQSGNWDNKVGWALEKSRLLDYVCDVLSEEAMELTKQARMRRAGTFRFRIDPLPKIRNGKIGNLCSQISRPLPEEKLLPLHLLNYKLPEVLQFSAFRRPQTWLQNANMLPRNS